MIMSCASTYLYLLQFVSSVSYNFLSIGLLHPWLGLFLGFIFCLKQLWMGWFSFLFFKRFYLFIFRQRGSGGEIEGEIHHCVVASHMPLTGDLARTPGMYPDWESNQRPFGLQAGVQSTEPHQPGWIVFLIFLSVLCCIFHFFSSLPGCSSPLCHLLCLRSLE